MAEFISIHTANSSSDSISPIRINLDRVVFAEKIDKNAVKLYFDEIVYEGLDGQDVKNLKTWNVKLDDALKAKLNIS